LLSAVPISGITTFLLKSHDREAGGGEWPVKRSKKGWINKPGKLASELADPEAARAGYPFAGKPIP
jgi:hypothetical protein